MKKLPYLATTIAAAIIAVTGASAQKQSTVSIARAKPAPAKTAEVGQTAVVIDDTLSVLRAKPSLYAETVQRMHRGRRVQILGTAEADGVKFYRVTAPPSSTGWIQADAVFGKFRQGDEERLVRVVQAAEGFELIEIATEFFALYPTSQFRPSILLLFGDLLEDVSVKLTKDANNKLKRREMAASGAPVHSYFLNYVSLDRYRKIGITFVFNPTARAFHYDGASWRELVTKYPKSPETAEAQKRLDSLKAKMAATTK